MSFQPAIQLRRLQPKRDTDIPLPAYMTPQAAGMDVCAAIETDQLLSPGEIALIPTGLAMAIPLGFVEVLHQRHICLVDLLNDQ